MKIANYHELTEEALKVGPGIIGVAWPDEHEVLLAIAEASEMGLARFLLVGDVSKIRAQAEAHQVDLSGMTLIDEPDLSLPRCALCAIAAGEAQLQ